MKAYLKNYNQAPRKVRLVADVIRGKSVPVAHTTLSFLDKKSSPILLKLLKSAVANANGYTMEDLVIKSITVDKGMVLKRMRPFKQGRAGRLHRIMSHVALELAPIAGAVKHEAELISEDEKKPSTAKKIAKKTAKKAVKKSAKKSE